MGAAAVKAGKAGEEKEEERNLLLSHSLISQQFPRSLHQRLIPFLPSIGDANSGGKTWGKSVFYASRANTMGDEIPA